MELKIDGAAVREVVQKAILDQIGTEGRDRLVTAALAYILTPNKDRYGQGLAPIQESFNQAVAAATNRIVNEIVAADPEMQRRLREMVGEAIVKMEATDFTDRLGSALSNALRDSSR